MNNNKFVCFFPESSVEREERSKADVQVTTTRVKEMKCAATSGIHRETYSILLSLLKRLAQCACLADDVTSQQIWYTFFPSLYC
jgi:hypothetical protein